MSTHGKHVLRAMLTVLALLLGWLGAGPAAATAAPSAEPVRIMPLGDSITGSPGCWRALLWNRLQEAGYTNVDFVGTLGPRGAGSRTTGTTRGTAARW